jgi:hypothetical protein
MATLTATYLGQTASTASLQGIAAVLVSINVTSGNLSVAAGLLRNGVFGSTGFTVVGI